MAVPVTSIVRFGEFTVDLRSGELWRGGDRIILPDQLLRILALLLRQPGNLVAREDLRRELWATDTFVDFEHGLNAAIKRLRDVLGDSATTPRFIETLPRRGYRFIAAVDAVPVHQETERSVVDSPTAAPARPRSRVRLVWAAAVIAPVVVTAVVVLTTRRLQESTDRRADAVSGGRLVRMTSTSGLNVDPALSPDGSLLAYASDRAGVGNLDIWIQPVGGSPLQITNSPGDEIEPSFSPDGTQLVFARAETGGVFIVDTLGGPPRQLVRAARVHNPRFSPDGRSVVYWTGLPVTISVAAGAAGSVFVVPVAGGLPRELAPDFATARHAVWSPDSRHLLFFGNRAADKLELDWYVVPAEGGNAIKTGALDALRRAGAASETDRPIPTAWIQRDDAVLVGATASARSNVWQLSIAPTTGMLVGSPRRRTFGTAVERNPSVAANGRIAFSSLVENVDVWRIRLDSKTGVSNGDLERVSENPAEDRIMNVIGKSLAFISSRTQQNELWIKDLETGTERQVTHSGANVARLSPDGSKVAFWGRSLGSIGVKILDLADSSTAAPCPDCERAFGWAPDGSRLLLAKAEPSRLFAYDLTSARLTELTGHPKWFLREGRYSPDGRWVAFYSANGPDKRQVHIIPSAPAHPLKPEQWLTVIDDVGSMPSWSDDGSLLYYISERDGALCLWVQPLDPLTKRSVGSPRVVQHFHQPRLRAGTGAIATTDVQGGYAYITLTETTGNIWMLEPADD